MGQLPSRVSELDKRRPVYLVCASGNRSKSMASLLAHQGFDAVTVAGGTGAWIQSGRPVTTGAHA
jgi:rhodanese-related sulfurtransferase